MRTERDESGPVNRLLLLWARRYIFYNYSYTSAMGYLAGEFDLASPFVP